MDKISGADIMETVLSLLMKSQQHLSGETMAETLGMSRAAVWKQIRKLEEEGFVIESAHRRGYRITSYPVHTLSPGWISALLASEHGIHELPLVYRASCPSTNALARELLVSGKETYARGNFAVLTDEQTAGRGRMDRKWIAAPGQDLTFSLSLYLDRPAAEFFYYVMMAGVAVYNAVNALCPVPGLMIKWPNDLYAGDKKICGTLSEMQSEGWTIRNLVVGVGLNVLSQPVLETAASILSLGGRAVNRSVLLARILAEFLNLRRDYETNGPEKLYSLWKDRMGWIGRTVTVDTGREIITGTLSEVRIDGGVTVTTQEGPKSFYSGDLLLSQLK